MKQLLSLILALILMIGAAVIPAAALEDTAEESAVTAVEETAEAETVEAEGLAAVAEAPAVPELAASGDVAPDVQPETIEAQEIAVPSPAVTTAKEDVAETGSEAEIAETGADVTVLKPTEAVKTGIRVKWKAFSGAAKYRVFLKNGSSWKKLADTTGLYYDHTNIKLETFYTYTVRAMDKKGAYCSSYDSAGKVGYKESTPTINKVENIAGGVKVTFTRPTTTITDLAVLIYRQRSNVALFVTGGTYGSKWNLIGVTDSDNTITAPIDAKNSNTTLKYTLRMSRGGYYTSVCSANKSALYVATPTFKVTATSAGQQITVNKVKGASKYRIFIKSSGKWKKLADTAASYVNKSVKAGGNYCYTVRAMNASGSYVSGYIESGITVGYRATPKLTKLEHINGGLKLSWSSVAYAPYYRVFRKGPDDKSWVTVADIDGTCLYDYTVEGGKKYTYTVRCIDGYGFYTSVYDTTGLSAVYRGTPEICYAGNSAEGITLAWTSEAVNVVPTYRLFVQQDGKWVAVTDTEEDYYTFTDVEEGEAYTFTVRGVNAQGKYCTSYVTTGFVVTYYKDAERTYDADILLRDLRNRVKWNYIPWGYCENADLENDSDAYRFAVAYTDSYGENTGDYTAHLTRMGMDMIDHCCQMMQNCGYDLRNDFDWYISTEENDGEVVYYLYLKENN